MATQDQTMKNVQETASSNGDDQTSRVSSYRRMQTPASNGNTKSKDQNSSSNNPVEHRQVYLKEQERNNVFADRSNVVVTSKYTIFSFLPKFLFESFCKVANFFFLVVSVLQTIKSISNTYGIPSNAPTLFFVICIDAIFAIMEDRRRHQSDYEANSATCHVVTTSQKQYAIENRLWSDVKVGDILQIRNREVIPADVLILAVAEPVGEVASGICYVETKSLDGETNLKLRQAIPGTLDTFLHPQDLEHIHGVVVCETPNPYINKFSGNIDLTIRNKKLENCPISIKNVLLRGCNLRNTDWVYGLVLNTGSDTKIMQSASSAPTKWSDIMILLNKMIMFLCIGLILLCAVAATVFVTWQNNIVKTAWYINTDPNINSMSSNNTINTGKESVVLIGSSAIVKEWFIMLFYYFLLLYQVIPISLYVSLTSVKFLQAIFMAWDKEMYHEETDTPAIVRTMALNEELGQISYVFSDKTGTLTCNIMEFRKCSINGISYGSGLTEIGRAALKRANKPIPEEPKLDSNIAKVPFVNFVDSKLFETMKGDHGEEEMQKSHEFFQHLAVCHTVIPEKLENGEVRLSASSPDEQALVAGAAFLGYCFESRSVGNAFIQVQKNGVGVKIGYDILEVLEFNSTRKRMSVVVRLPDKQLYLYTKGADMMIYQRLDKNSEQNKKLEQITMDHMEKYADDGLRTLALAVKKLDEENYAKWSKNYRNANGSIEELEKRKDNLPNLIDTLMEEIESGLELIGATAIEDKLQDGVPDCLSSLTAAGIKVWMLTGDKEETAINIGYACALLDNSINQVILNMDTYPTLNDIQSKLTSSLQDSLSKTNEDFALIIDGEALEYAYNDPETQKKLLNFAKNCVAVICCRVSPAQKAEMVTLIRENVTHARTLAIGDGANDVAMIQAAHIGIGISGQEGMQAVNSSDYAIAQFRFLKRLLLIHGRWNYLRISKVILYMFYKNITLVLAQYWYGFLSGASGSKMYWEVGVQVYNIFFTGLPIVVVGVLDQDLPDNYVLQYPSLYLNGPNRVMFNLYTFGRWICAAIYESLIIFIMIIYGYNSKNMSSGSDSRVEYGMVAFTLAVVIVNLKICLIIFNWTWISRLTWWISVLSWFLIAYLCNTVFTFMAGIKISYDEFGSFVPTLVSPAYWFLILLGSFIALGRHFTWNQYQRLFYPELFQILQETVCVEKLRGRRLTINDTEVQAFSITLDDVSEEERLQMASRYNQSQSQDQVLPMIPEGDQPLLRNGSNKKSKSAGHKKKGLSRRSTGFAFSCDEETTLAESYIASNVSSKSLAMANANSRGSFSSNHNS